MDKKKIFAIIPIIAIIAVIAVIVIIKPAWLSNEINELNGTITGNTYEAQFYSNTGDKFMTAVGKKIDIK